MTFLISHSFYLKEIYLLNKRKAVIPGVNPIRFDNLEQYAEYLRWQRRVGIRCPVLFFEEGYNTQNQKIWRHVHDFFYQSFSLLSIVV